MIRKELFKNINDRRNYVEHVKQTNLHKPTQPRMPPISIGGGIGEQRGENKRILFTLN